MKHAVALLLTLLAGLPAMHAAGPELQIRIVYDNTAARPDMRADWGFAAVIDFRGHRVLFDSGMKPEVLLENLTRMNIDPASIEQAVISHAHGDHANGITAILGKNPKLTLHRPGASAEPFPVTAGIHSTGMVKGMPPEQALVIETSKGLVVITGCSHPGVVRMIEAAETQHARKNVRLLVGGFHMLDMNSGQVDAVISRLRELQVGSIVPTHCTGDAAIKRFQSAFGSNFEAGGAGRGIVLE